MTQGSQKYDRDARQARPCRSVARLLQDSLNVCRDRVLAKLAGRGHGQVNMSHSAVLRNMDTEGTSLSEVTRRAGISRQAVAKVSAQLEALGYLATEPDPTDRRAKVLRLTPQGMRLFIDLIEAYGEFEAELAECVGRRRLEEFRRTLQNIARLGPSSTSPILQR